MAEIHRNMKKRRDWQRKYFRELAVDPNFRQKQKGYKLKSRYGVTIEQVASRVIEQDCKCAICLGPLNVQHIDHDHVTGQFRGVLCAPCNKGLGHFRDSPEALRRAAAYLEGHRGLLQR